MGTRDLLRDYDDYLVNWHKDHQIREPGIHASEISSCHRKAVYTMMGVEKRTNTSPKWQRKFEHGKCLHSMIQGHFHKMADTGRYGFKFRDEVRISPESSEIAKEYQIFSSCDGVFTFTDGSETGLEIKSISPTDYGKLQKPKTEHVEQSHVYMMCLDLDSMWLLYYDKGTDLISPPAGGFIVNRNPHTVNSLMLRFDSWYEHIRLGTLPEKSPGVYCQFCSYTWTCNPVRPTMRERAGRVR